ncbi:MAG TPA: hypothetical protein VLD58_09620 [Gemmatimonadales bacterium]|nr:hypothetical protein [Gemmatimonadales bacterium]
MHRIAFVGMLAVLSLLPALPGHAQATPSSSDLVPGSRIRVSTGVPSRMTGTLVDIGGDSLRLVVGKRDTLGVPLSAVTRLEESRGRRANYTKGALIGGGIGLALGLGVGALADGLRNIGCESPSCDNPSQLGGALAIGGLAGAGVGAGVGALLAGVFQRERWQPVVRPSGALQVGVRLRF